ncbi:MAG TPA: hypothetical protein VNN07_01145 [Candidatus Tectomicrobia bacterium]|nr:hypothetical protein [Candidatus Tectomicrobia bacterium]
MTCRPCDQRFGAMVVAAGVGLLTEGDLMGAVKWAAFALVAVLVWQGVQAQIGATTWA